MSSRQYRISGRGVQLAATSYGAPGRTTILLIHGYPDTSAVWDLVREQLVERYQVITYDVRGAGGSTAPAHSSGYDLEQLTDDVLAVLDTVAAGLRVHLVGHDWGSVQGWEFATSERLDGRLASFTSISGPSLDHFGHWVADRRRRHRLSDVLVLAAQSVRSWYVGALHIPGGPALAWNGPVGRRWPALVRRAAGGSLPHGYPSPTLRGDAVRGANLYRRNVLARLRHPREDPYATVPVQLVVPTRDVFLSPHIYDDLDRWSSVLRRHRISAGHWLPLSHPAQLAGWIAEFVEDVEGGTVSPVLPRQGGRKTQSSADRHPVTPAPGS
ncbi:alpha/beta fold hydrolase [Frankia sp. Cppng1_Ct_nod]|uniref:alpha/beta fold hydrolase n=1 Tax=Frankia sp. Cppng1_Ct_nod TaxID=2897162 RepID=UPI0013EF984F|nr:alpha/beta fold hydrolase [Frankia sp. Cppng1_Ct_nod]